MFEPVVCTLLEKDYHFGLAALVNSLHQSGYQGIIFAGIRGSLPPWANALRPCPRGQEFVVHHDLRIRFIELTTTDHLTFYKPLFLKEVLNELAPEASAAIYFDPDIVIKAPWMFFSNWVGSKIAVCEDLNWRFHHTHPLRREWRALLEPKGVTVPCQLDVYFNAGFIGLAREHALFLDKWQEVLTAIRAMLEDCVKMTIGDRSYPFHKGDQDAMNIAADCFADDVSIMGPEGMDFINGGYTMSHAIGIPKPWSKNFVLSALSGVAPSFADKAFMAHAMEPIAVYDTATYQMRCLDLRVGSAIGRILRRS